MEIIDYNGTGKWSRDAILKRYFDYSAELGLKCIDLTPNEHASESKKWIYPAMEKIIAGIEVNDSACKRIGIEFIEEDAKLSFGKILKSNTARALRRANLNESEKERIRTRLIDMLIKGNVPHEYKQYAKLLKKIGVGKMGENIKQQVNRDNPYVMKYVNYLFSA